MRILECLLIPGFIWSWLLACGNLCTTFAIWKKISEGRLCRFACSYLMISMRSACGWSGCGPLIVLFHYTCLLHVTNLKSRCYKWRWCCGLQTFKNLFSACPEVVNGLNRCFLYGSPRHVQLCLYVQCIILASCVFSLESGENGVPFPLSPTLRTAGACCLPSELVVPL